MKVFIYRNGLMLDNYVKAVTMLGHTPIYSSDLTLSSNCDCLILTGGLNVHPYFYGNLLHPLKSVDLPTDLREYCLIRRFLQERKPILGVCKGMQLINVFFGGTLKFVNEHANCEHDVTDLNGNSFKVNSHHEQAVDSLSPTLKATLYSNDGVIEGFKHKTLNVKGVQFHPERMGENFIKRFIEFS
ncbi:MAG: gamma-glutamyl-gamma-aminobutyrate hydrolase family protein [Clostridia bacterium]|nr:gamma-glutamyl-gamma-aminobutyrate hydrolase family protein [Clostridia bacterium]